MLDKAASIAADVLVYDVEDSVPAHEKPNARTLIAKALDAPNRRSRRFLRVSTVESRGFLEDIEVCIGPGLDGVVLPKVESPSEVQRADALLSAQESKVGLSAGSLHVLATIETARGVLAAGAVAVSSTRLIGLMIGGEDLKRDLGTLDFTNATHDEMSFARSSVAFAASSGGLVAVDRVVPDFRDLALLSQDCLQARRLGFRGKAVIHPTQVATVNEHFSPSSADISKARQVVEAYDASSERGAGSIAVDGQMVDLPVAETARQIIEYAEAIEQLERRGETNSP